ncbi:hypothetical protein KEM60_02761 [Austwickia sp. TVS 96-490-7B]|uniref:hypothetical protein n=1 Tax=Austwickia sp. TVS 96-490-7B TaxID=2830843 RepID=UPI001C5A1B9C|nr:hypothetical protein [Austwickia sp. TVS 96-490-7B]MBW3086538.1 hypothetical protein [Austwickia sp. TVS 96-490-7B]
MHSPRGLAGPPTSSTRAPFSDTAEADDRVYHMVEQQANWVALAVAQADPQQWLFAQRERFRRDGVCDPWAEQMLYRAGLLPLAG